MGLYSSDRRWADAYVPLMKQLIGPHLLRTSSFEEDVRHASDLILLRAEGLTIACRVRRACYFEKYGDEFTIRDWRGSGAETELSKIRKGRVHLMFYGFAAEGFPLDFIYWSLLDLAVFLRDEETVRSVLVDNHDGTSGAAYKIQDFGDDFVIAKGGRTYAPQSGMPFVLERQRT